MKKIQICILFGLLSILLLFGFNNCGSEVGFKDIESVEKSGSDALDEDVQPATEEQIAEVVADIPQEELDVLRPVSDLENDPSLLELYACDSSSVLICHFPNNVEGQHSTCIGINAVTTHYDHIRQYLVDGETRQIGDYLGPCRFSL